MNKVANRKIILKFIKTIEMMASENNLTKFFLRTQYGITYRQLCNIINNGTNHYGEAHKRNLKILFSNITHVLLERGFNHLIRHNISNKSFIDICKKLNIDEILIDDLEIKNDNICN